MIWLGIGLLVVGIILGIFKLGSQFLDVLQLNFSEVGENILWLIFSFLLSGIGIVVFIIGLVKLIF